MWRGPTPTRRRGGRVPAPGRGRPSPSTATNRAGEGEGVKVEEEDGNGVMADTSTVTLTLRRGRLEGGVRSKTAPAVNGVASFGGLKIDVAATYTVSATDGTLIGTGPSNPFIIN